MNKQPLTPLLSLRSVGFSFVALASGLFAQCNGATNFTYTIPMGFNFIANPANATLSATNLFPDDGSEDGSYVYFPNGCPGTSTIEYGINSGLSPTGWIGGPLAGQGAAPPTLTPGEGFFFVNTVGYTLTVNFNGPAGTATPLPCDCGNYNLVGSVTGSPATYQDIVGSAPMNGSRLLFYAVPGPGSYGWGPEYIYTCGGWTVYSGGSWVPASPPPVAVGQGVAVVVPCGPVLTGLSPAVAGSAYIGTSAVKNYVLTVVNNGPNPSSAATLQLTGIPGTMNLTPPAGATVIPGGFMVNVPAGLACGDSLSYTFSLATGSTPAGTSFTMNASFQSTYPRTNSLTVEVVGSYGTNDDNGPLGIGPRHNLTGHPPLPYTISFENPATASVPVQNAVVTTMLDPTTMGLGSFQFGPITVGNLVLTPPPGVDMYSNTVPYNLGGNPANAANLQIVASVNHPYLTPEESCTATWTFQTLDPNTGLPPTNSAIGFLPPNTSPPAGQATVSFTLNPLPTLLTGSLVMNSAQVVYGTSVTNQTEVWTNSLNEPAPSLTILRAPAGQVTVSWPSWTLQEASSLLGPWTNSAVQTSPWTFAPSQPVKFYRLQAP